MSKYPKDVLMKLTEFAIDGFVLSNGEAYVAIPENPDESHETPICAGCSFEDFNEACVWLPYCKKSKRLDNRSIIWKKTEPHENQTTEKP